jgi:TolB-like protein/DNA-binding SARP family transcriptional activator/Flp pilus assembly protein TadD
MSRDKLIAYLWPEVDAERARHLLSNSLYVIRQALGEDVLVGSADAIRLNFDRMCCDVRQFEDALWRGELELAVGLYAGPFLDGFFLSDMVEFEQWVERERGRLAAAYTRAVEALAEAAEGNRDFCKAADWWKVKAAEDPYDSRVALRLMEALESGGNRGGALQHLALHQRLLQEELGMAPAPEVVALAERLRSAPIATAPAVNAESGNRGVRVREPPPRKVEPSTPADTSPAGPAEPPLVAAVEERPAARGWWWGAAALLAVAAIVGAIAWLRPPEPERSIVVLPFMNMSPDRDNDYFSDGLTEEIITRLATVPDLKVISRTSAMHYKGSPEPLRQIANELDVAHVLEGSVRRSGGRLRITAQLIDAHADEHLWAASYDFEPRDVFSVQEEIAREVVRALEVELGERGRTLLARQGTDDPVAFDVYRRGRFLWSTRTKEAHEKAIEYFQQAIERDSSYADAYAGLADTYLTAFQNGLSTLPEAEVYSRVKWAAERALALDDQSADAHASFAVSLWWQRNWPGAERELRRAIELNPGHASARSWYALLLGGMGRTEEAVRESRRAAELDPLSMIISIIHAWTCYVGREYDCAVEQFGRTLEIDSAWAPAYTGLGMTYAQKGMHQPAITALSKAVELRPGNSTYRADLATVYALAGRKAEAAPLLKGAKADAWEGFHIARAYAALGEKDSAFAWFERSSWRWPHRAVRADPALDPLRADPRFDLLVQRVDREMGLR